MSKPNKPCKTISRIIADMKDRKGSAEIRMDAMVSFSAPDCSVALAEWIASMAIAILKLDEAMVALQLEQDKHDAYDMCVMGGNTPPPPPIEDPTMPPEAP